MSQLNPRLLTQLSSLIPSDTMATWQANLSREQENSLKKINTPATTCTTSSWRKEPGNAIDKIRRKRKINQEATNKEDSPQKEQADGELDKEDTVNGTSKLVTDKIIIKNKAVFFGQDCELPYLHSSDAITNLYTRKKDDSRDEVLYNPANTIDSSYMTSLKSLHIYHTSIDSLRQLGTGWCNLKQLSIVYGKLTDLSGLSSFCSLEYLFLSFNMISSLSDLMFHPSIKCIDLQRNRIENSQEIEYLATVDKLEWVNLNHNPVMRIKETRRIIQEKLGKMLEMEEHGRLQEFVLEEIANQHYLLSFQNIESCNHLVKTCNDNLAGDEITLQNLYESHLTCKDEPKAALDFIRYQLKQSGDFFQDSAASLQQAEEEIFFTPLIHFLSGKKFYTPVLRKYFQNKIYLNMKKADSNHSPAHSLATVNSTQRLNKFSASTRLEKDKEDVFSLDKKESMTTDLSSLDKGKRGRLSLGRTKKLLERFDKANPVPPTQLKFANTFGASINATTSKTFSLKRTLLKKPSIADLQGQIEKKFSKTLQFKAQ